MGSRFIARALDEANILCRRHCWHHSTVRTILKRPVTPAFSTGDMSFNRVFQQAEVSRRLDSGQYP